MLQGSGSSHSVVSTSVGSVEKTPDEQPLAPAPGAAIETLALWLENRAIWPFGIVAPTERPMLQPPFMPPT